MKGKKPAEHGPCNGRAVRCALWICVLLTLLPAAPIGCRRRGAEEARKRAFDHCRLAGERYRKGDIDGAVATYEKALQLNPRLAEAHLDLGIIYDDYIGDRKMACAHYREFLKLQPASEKSEMVARWIQRVEDDGVRVAGARPASVPTPQLAPAEDSGEEIEQVPGELDRIRVENEAYLKTIQSLRDELSRLREETASQGVEKEVKARASAEKELSLREAQLLQRELSAARAAVAERDKKIALLLSDNNAMLARIREAEKRGTASKGEVAGDLTGAEDTPAPQDSSRLLEKSVSDAEREKEELRRSYEKRITELGASFERERDGMRKRLAEALRSRSRLEKSEVAVGASGQSRPPAPAARESAAAVRRYRVARGDTLRTIAQRIYGNQEYWVKIYEANKGKFSGSSPLRPGMILTIP